MWLVHACWPFNWLVLEYYWWQAANILIRSVFDALSIGYILVAAVLLCLKRGVIIVILLNKNSLDSNSKCTSFISYPFHSAIGTPPIQSPNQFLTLFRLVVVSWRRSSCLLNGTCQCFVEHLIYIAFVFFILFCVSCCLEFNAWECCCSSCSVPLSVELIWRVVMKLIM